MDKPEEKNLKNRKRRLRVALLIVLAGLGVSGYFFWAYIIQSNFQTVIPGKVYRSGQPSMEQLQSWIPKHGIRTVINLRGDKLEICRREKAMAEAMDVDVITLGLGARRLVSKAGLLHLIAAVETAQRPLLVHCQWGVDRSGFASMLAVLAEGKSSYADAKSQLAVTVVRWGKRKIHINDTLILYEDYCRQNKLDPNNWPQFKQWAKDVYQPRADQVETERYSE